MKVYLVDSKQWYITPEQANAYLAVLGTEYANDIVAGENALIGQLTSILRETFAGPRKYVDLGPGDGKKTDVITRELVKQNLISHYECVDIQSAYIDIASKLAIQKGLTTSQFNGSFEDYLTQYTSDGANFIYLGATYCNLDREFDGKLSNAMHKSDLVYLSSALFPHNIEEIIKGYQTQKISEIFAPICQIHGIAPDNFHVEFNYSENQVEMGFRERNKFYILGVSRKPTKEEFASRISENFTGELMSNSEHVGFVGKVRD
jgi:hypothetical protein